MSSRPNLDAAGPVFTPQHPGYADEVRGYNQIVTHHPRVVVGATCPADVAAAVRYGAEAGLSVGVQATGHGVSVPATGVLINTTRMRGIDFDPVTRSVTVSAGVVSGDLLAALSKQGLTPLGGSSPGVGVVGYHLGGGIPLLGRAFGYAADRVRALDVVTADGVQRTVTPGTEPDLFWALLGGRGNYGVVTSLTTEAVPLTTVVGGGLWFTGAAIVSAVRAYVEWAAEQPREMASSILLMRMPDIDAIPEPIRGRRIAHVRIGFVGGSGQAERRLAGLRSAAPAVLDTVTEMPCSQLATIHNEPAGPVSFEARNCLLGDLDVAAADTLLDHAGANGCDDYLVELRHLGGALGPSSQSRAAVGRRDGRFILYTGSALGPLTREAAARMQGLLHAMMAHWEVAGGGVTPAFLSGPHVTRTQVRSAFTETDFARLGRVKGSWDPMNLFRVNQNIHPSRPS